MNEMFVKSTRFKQVCQLLLSLIVVTQPRGPCTHLLYIDTADWTHQVHNQMHEMILESCAFSY